MSVLPRIARRLVFYTHPHDLTRDTTLLLSFLPANIRELHRDHARTAWKVLLVSGGGVGTTALVTYSARLGFVVKQSSHGNITIPQTHVEVGLGQSTRLSTSAAGFIHWSVPTSPFQPADFNNNKRSTILRAFNDTLERRDIHVGLFNTENSMFEPIITMYVSNGAAAVVEFLPHLHVFAYSRSKNTPPTNTTDGKYSSISGSG
ncbi:unnamed protein product [Rhizoctonia solani]|uniref:Uncharacterized protein n=1 Tax=Rhizoctonia solani TaxID=456999 RepID=A0A8H3CWV1_9AGAM|nr:unnamed protein product [Rhizoctonia solani]